MTPLPVSSPQHQSGFTLIETLIALFVVSLGMISVLMIFPFVSKQLSLAELTTQASFLAQAKMENLIALAYNQISVGQAVENSLTENFSTFSRQTDISYVDANLSSSQSDTGLKKIVVTVTSLARPELNYQLTTLIAGH